MPPLTSSSEEKKRFVRRLAKAFGTCTEESRQYGLCLQRYMEGVERAERLDREDPTQRGKPHHGTWRAAYARNTLEECR